MGLLCTVRSGAPELLSEPFAEVLGTHKVENFSACSQAVTSSGLELSRSIGVWN